VPLFAGWLFGIAWFIVEVNLWAGIAWWVLYPPVALGGITLSIALSERHAGNVRRRAIRRHPSTYHRVGW
jgi:hypothetical protein